MIDGKWQRLTDYLESENKNEIVLTDEEIQLNIVDSTDKTRPYNIDFSDEKYSIRKRAEEASYSVEYHPLNKRIKIFKKV